MLISVLLIGTSSFATHVAGGDISYECIGPNQYRITAKFFRDCTGVSAPTSINLGISNTCGFANPSATAVLQDPASNADCTGALLDCATEVSQLCPAMQNQSLCHPGGTLPGMQMYRYSAVVTLPGQCNTWTFSFSVNARNCCNNLSACPVFSGGSGETFYTEASLSSSTAPCNNSPIFTAQPIPYVCQNQPVSYSYGVVEMDGDSLVYSLEPAKNSLAGVCGYNAPFTGTNPIQGAPGATLDAATGLLSFTPTVVGIWVIVVKVTEIDPITLQVKGYSVRDIQFVVQPCANDVPSPTGGQITALTGDATMTGPYSLELCEGDQFCFDAVFPDINISDTLTAQTNITLSLPGSTFSYTGFNPITAQICWTAPPLSALSNNSFIVFVKDDACPVVGIQTFVYDVFVSASAYAGPDTLICDAMQATLHGIGGNVFTWSVLSGEPINIGVNFTCNPCQDPIATPNSTTTYLLTTDLTNTCSNTDTVTVFVIDSLGLSLSALNDTMCLMQPLPLYSNVTVPGTYTYSWTPIATLNNPALANPVATFTAPGPYEFFCQITSATGCVETDSISIQVNNFLPPPATAVISDNPFCMGDSAQLNIQWGIPVPSSCGISTNTCGSPTTFGIGTSTIDNIGLPTPFAGSMEDSRIQMIYPASELNLVGFNGGTIQDIMFDITNIGSFTSYENFTIKLGCSGLSNLSSGFQTGLTTVFGPTSFVPSMGSPIVFTNPYDWNGASSLIVEICWDNDGVTSNDDEVNRTNTGYVSTIQATSTGVAASGCSLGSPTNYNKRVNTTFSVCATTLDTLPLQVSWAPPGNVSNSTIHAPWTENTVTVIDTLIVFDPATTCTTRDTIQVNISNPMMFAGTDTGVCQGSTIGLLATGTNVATYAWSPPANLSATNIANPTVLSTFSANTNYIVTGTDNIGCTDKDTVLVEYWPNPVVSFTGLDPQYCSTAPIDLMLTLTPPGGFFTGAGAFNSGGTWYYYPFNAGAGADTLVYHFVDGNGCSGVDSQYTNIIPFNNGDPFFIADFKVPPYYCPDEMPDTMSYTPPGGTFGGPGVIIGTTIFNPSLITGITPPADTTYVFYTYTDINSCVDTAFQQLIVWANPQLSFSNLDPGYCLNDPIVTLSTVPVTGGTVYINGSPGNQFNPASLGVGTHEAKFGYQSGVTGCNDTIEVDFQIYGLPTVDAGADDSICAGSSGVLSGTGGVTYLWSPGATLSDSTSQNPVPSPTQTTKYLLTATDGNGCSNMDSAMVHVFNNPSVSITADPERGIVPTTVQFNLTGTDHSFYAWNFGDGTTSTDQNPLHTYDHSGQFYAIVNVLNSNSLCSGSDTVIIFLTDSVIIEQFNVFTPDGDGSNDLFQVKNQGLIELEVEIFNRWGKKVGGYSGVTESDGWDGKTEGGKPCDDGVYYYMAKGVGQNQEIFNDIKGFFHLVGAK